MKRLKKKSLVDTHTDEVTTIILTFFNISIEVSPGSKVTDLLSDGLSRHQVRFNGDEECDEGSFAQTPQNIITTVGVAAFSTVAQQNCRSVDPERSINLKDVENKHTTTDPH